jgi:hypothetical protein
MDKSTLRNTEAAKEYLITEHCKLNREIEIIMILTDGERYRE